MGLAKKLKREDYYAKRKAQMQENVEKCRQLAEQGFTKHEISNKTGIAVKTIEKYALKNGFKYAHKPITVKEKIKQVKSITEDIKIQQKRNMSESKPIMKAAEGLSESIQKGEVKFPLEDLIQPDGAVNLEDVCNKLTEKEHDAIEPIYYKALKHEPIDVIEDWRCSFNTGSALKYIARAGKKADNPAIQDLLKARYYIDREIERLRKVNPAPV